MKFLRLAVLLALLLLAVVIGSVAALVALVDPNDYKAEIAAKVAKETGRTLTLEGPIEWGLWPTLRLKAGPLSLSNAPGFGEEPFLAAEELQIAVATLPLLSERIEMDTVRLYGARLNLAKNAVGITNWADLVKGGGEKRRRGGGDISALVLGGVDIQDAALTWRDATTGRDLEISKLNVTTGALTFGDPIEFKLSAALKSLKPAIAGDTVLAGTVAYDIGAEHYVISPLALDVTLRGKTLPNGEAKIAGQTAIDINLAEETAQISELKLEGLGAAISGDVAASRIESERPGAQGKLVVTGKDLALIFKAFELPAAAQLAGIKDRSFEFKTTFDANMDSGDVKVPELSGRLLGATLNGELTAQAANTDKPSIKGTLAAAGPDLPTLLIVLSQFQGADAKTTQSLTKALAQTKDKRFAIDAAIDADFAAGRMDLPKLSAQLLGNELSGAITSGGGTAGKPAFKGRLAAKGPDLPALLAAVAALQGADAKSVDNLTGALSKVKDRSFTLETTLDADMGKGELSLPALSGSLLGNQVTGVLAATAADTPTPAVKGELKASGPDLAALLAVAGGFQGPDSGLTSLAKALAGEADKRFTLATAFDADFKQGRVELSKLTAEGLGMAINGAFKAANINSDSGAIDGRLTIKGSKPAALLKALGQVDLAKSVHALDLDAGIKGTMADLTLSPFDATALVAGAAGAKPVALKLTAGTAQANLGRETLTVKDLTLTGLGLDIKGTLDATQIKTAPAYSGQLNVPAFNLRNVLADLNKPLPPMADPQALASVGLDTAFKGTSKGVTLSGLNVRLDQTTLKGEIAIPDFGPPEVNFGLNADSLNADRYLPPTSKGEARPVTPEAAAAGATQLPIETLRKLKIKGELNVDSLQFSGAKLANVRVSIAGAGGKIVVNPVAADLYQGKYTGIINIDATQKQPLLAINTTLAKVAIEPLLTDLTGKSALSGIVNFEARLQATGGDSKRITNTLTGPASFAIQNGVFRGVDVPAVLTAAEIIIESKAIAPIPKGGETHFQSLTGSLDIKNGVIFNKDLLLDGQGFKVTGEGMLANLNDMTLKYDTKIAVDEGRAEQGTQAYNLGGYVIPMRCRGPISGKSCLPDLGDLAKTAATAAAKKEVEKKVKEAIGDKAGDTLKKLLKF